MEQIESKILELEEKMNLMQKTNKEQEDSRNSYLNQLETKIKLLENGIKINDQNSKILEEKAIDLKISLETSFKNYFTSNDKHFDFYELILRTLTYKIDELFHKNEQTTNLMEKNSSI